MKVFEHINKLNPNATVKADALIVKANTMPYWWKREGKLKNIIIALIDEFCFDPYEFMKENGKTSLKELLSEAAGYDSEEEMNIWSLKVTIEDNHFGSVSYMLYDVISDEEVAENEYNVDADVEETLEREGLN